MQFANFLLYNYTITKRGIKTMNNEKETKRTTRKTIFIIAMDSIVVILKILSLCINSCKLYEVKHYDKH